MYYSKKATIEVPEREPDEPPCTPEQAVRLASLDSSKSFDEIRKLGTWQAANVIAQAGREEEKFNEEVANVTFNTRPATRLEKIELALPLLWGLIWRLVVGGFLLWLVLFP